MREMAKKAQTQGRLFPKGMKDHTTRHFLRNSQACLSTQSTPQKATKPFLSSRQSAQPLACFDQWKVGVLWRRGNSCPKLPPLTHNPRLARRRAPSQSPPTPYCRVWCGTECVLWLGGRQAFVYAIVLGLAKRSSPSVPLSTFLSWPILTRVRALAIYVWSHPPNPTPIHPSPLASLDTAPGGLRQAQGQPEC